MTAKNKTKYFLSFALGMILILAMLPILNIFKQLAYGFEIQSLASFPYLHNAKVRTRPGGGDQTLFLEVDGKDVWQSGDMPPGDLGEKLSWDTAGKIVTLELQEQPFVRYDTESGKLVEMEDKEPIKLK